ncbi:DUF3363 domain-containing protein, partial [Escherichia coli]|uniref:DUF3363 domain-containing protein n=1 Tax=Escherichia coli TaxID=562 RepID=UPI002B266463
MGEKGVYSSYTCRVPGGDYEGYVDAHVRRLEALRRAGIVERIDADQWRIPDDLVSRAAAHDAGRDGTVAKLAMRQPFVLFKGLTFQKLCL